MKEGNNIENKPEPSAPKRCEKCNTLLTTKRWEGPPREECGFCSLTPERYAQLVVSDNREYKTNFRVGYILEQPEHLETLLSTLRNLKGNDTYFWQEKVDALWEQLYPPPPPEEGRLNCMVFERIGFSVINDYAVSRILLS